MGQVTMAAPFALAGLLVLPACAAPPPPAPPAPLPAYATLAASRAGSPVDGEMLAIGRAEEEIDRALATSSGGPRKAGPKGVATDASNRDDAQKNKDGKPDVAAKEEQGGGLTTGGGEACAAACRALGSMAASAERLCQLAGQDDGRCDDARARVRGASARVKSACPACSVSVAAPPRPASAPAKDAPAGPAPGMPGSSSPPIP